MTSKAELCRKLIDLLGTICANINITDMDDNEYSFDVKDIANWALELEAENAELKREIESLEDSWVGLERTEGY